ncbi:MAG: extracellular solute-binding protein [Spirochaetaceae bacterium]|nr:extracellular solute-binding protein [Spirochaetaceae bacterium]
MEAALIHERARHRVQAKSKHCPARAMAGFLGLTIMLGSCSLFEKKSAVLWTDSPEMLLAVEMFNSSQNRHLLEVHYVADLADALVDRPKAPSLVIGKGLRTEAITDYFQSLEYLFGELVLSKNSFYPALLEGGVLQNRQVFLPVSFNTMMVICRKGALDEEASAPSLPSQTATSPTVQSTSITVPTMKRLARNFNLLAEKNKAPQMAFSPRWPDKDFLFQWMQLQGADFQERMQANSTREETAYPIKWNPEGLDSAMNAARIFIRDTNGSAEKEDAFSFKYLYTPGYRNVESGTILFTALDSASFFLLPEEVRRGLEFRYLEVASSIAVSEDIRYAGIPRTAPNKESAEQFLRWFFNPDSQKAILERSKSLQLSESEFGIAGGFSSIQHVNEASFPGCYPEIREHTPPKTMLRAPRNFPPGWKRLKSELVLPWMDEMASKSLSLSADEDFRLRLDAYLGKNPDLRTGLP